MTLSTAAQVGPTRKTGAKRPDERRYVLPLFREAGERGINRLHFLQGTGPLNGKLVTQVSRLINSLEKEGYLFKHIVPPKKYINQLKARGCTDQYQFFTTYVLVSEPIAASEGRITGKVLTAPSQRGNVSGWRREAFVYGSHSRPQVEAKAVLGKDEKTAEQQTLLGLLDTLTSVQGKQFTNFETGKIKW